MKRLANEFNAHLFTAVIKKSLHSNSVVAFLLLVLTIRKPIGGYYASILSYDIATSKVDKIV